MRRVGSDVAVARIQWSKYHRLINSAFPPIDLFDDIADPEDWLLIGAGESQTNPRVSESIGNLDLVPPQHRVGGTGATYVMAPFTHVSPELTGRFHDGTCGAFYAANNFETAVMDTAYHRSRFYAASDEAPGWIAELRELIGSIAAELVDIRRGGFATILDPDSYQASQRFAKQQREAGKQGIVYPSVRDTQGECFAAFYPDVMSVPVQGQHIAYHWNGKRIDQLKSMSGKRRVFRIQA